MCYARSQQGGNSVYIDGLCVLLVIKAHNRLIICHRSEGWIHGKLGCDKAHSSLRRIIGVLLA